MTTSRPLCHPALASVHLYSHRTTARLPAAKISSTSKLTSCAEPKSSCHPGRIAPRPSMRLPSGGIVLSKMQSSHRRHDGFEVSQCEGLIESMHDGERLPIALLRVPSINPLLPGRAASRATSAPGLVSVCHRDNRSGLSLEHHVEGRLGGPADGAPPCVAKHLAQLGLPRLRTKRQASVLGLGDERADRR